MKIIKGNIWDYWKQGHWIVIPTNGFIKKNGECVMGRGLALQAKDKFTHLSRKLAENLKIKHTCYQFYPERIFSFPVKYNWWEKADLKLIEKSAKSLSTIFSWCGAFYYCDKKTVYLPKVGCGNGNLNWNDVNPILDKYLDERFIIVDLK
jgi:hypothetical protein